MLVRHVVAADNVDANGYVIDPGRARHCVITAARLSGLSGDVDPLTHLNLDFRNHTLGECVIAEQLEPGARVLLDAEGRLRFAVPRLQALLHLGRVDLDARRIAWLDLLRARREARSSNDG